MVHYEHNHLAAAGLHTDALRLLDAHRYLCQLDGGMDTVCLTATGGEGGLPRRASRHQSTPPAANFVRHRLLASSPTMRTITQSE